MHRSFIAMAAGALSLGLIQTAAAADMPVKAPMLVPVAPISWTGFYVGITGGGAFGNTGASETGIPNAGALAPFASADYGLGHNLTGWLLGGLLGYNYQMGQWLVGIEADFSGANINGSGTITGA